MADEKCRAFPRKVRIDSINSVHTNYGNKAGPEQKELEPIINAILEAMLTGMYAGETIIHTGPGPGPDPEGDGTISLKLSAGEALVAGNAVVIKADGKVYKANSSDLNQYEFQAGMVAEAVAAGAQAKVVCYGQVTNPAWNYAIGEEIYIGTNGVATTTIPTVGMVWVLGRSVSKTSILVAPEKPVVL